MKRRYYLLIAILAYLSFTLAMFPAQPIVSLINDNTTATLGGVSGSIWDGRARSIDVEGVRLSDTHWNMKAWKLLIGQAVMDIDTYLEDEAISGEIGASVTGTVFANTLNGRVSAETVTRLANIPMAQLAGMIDIAVEHISWSQGELPEVDGRLVWKDASVTVAETASLGDVSIVITQQDDSLRADVNNNGGDIELNGDAALNPEAEYQANIRFKPTASASQNLRRSLGLFAEPQGDGTFLLKNSGSLKQLGLI